MKRLLVLLMVLALFVPVWADAQGMSGPPEVRVLVNDVEIPCVTVLNKWNGATVKRMATFPTLVEQQQGREVPYCEPGAEVRVKFSAPVPDRAELSDRILNPDGTDKYSAPDQPDVQSLTEFPDGWISFELEPNPMSMLSSDGADYEPGASLRGFLLKCWWGENECEYAFMLRTDAGIAAQSKSDDPYEQIAALEPQDYEGLFSWVGRADGAYADALAWRLGESFALNGNAFVSALLACDEQTRTGAIDLLVYEFTIIYGEMESAQAMDALEQLLDQHERPDLLGYIQAQVKANMG